MNASPRNILPVIGFGLLIATFVISLTQVARRAADQRDPSLRVIRIAHWQLEDGASQAIDTLAREYERLHPGVRIEQLRIPEKVYPNWVTTQLVGGTAPDLIQIGKGIDTERVARYFRPITEDVVQPNPYNVGTIFADTPWRETFVDGMIGGFDDTLQDYYGAPLFMATVRMYANETLLRQITGSSTPPRNLDELLSVAARAETWASENNQVVVPIAGSKYNAPILIERLFRSTTQRLALDLSANHQLVVAADRLMLDYVKGNWSLETPAVVAGLELAGKLGSHMQPGFLQLAREDATFLFQQSRALFIATGSWDASTLIGASTFPVRIFDLPVPSTDHPDYGKFVLGRHSEAGARTYGPFGVTRASEHPELALDFMRFLTSLEHNQTYADLSGWLPVTATVKPAAAISAFAPVSEGYPDGFYLSLAPDMQRIVENNLHLLFARTGGPDQFRASVAAPLREAALSDLRRMLTNRNRQIARADLIVAAEEVLTASGATDSARRAIAQHENQLNSEFNHALISADLEALD